MFSAPKVPVRTTSRSPVLSRRDSPLQGSGQQNSQAGQRNSTSSIEPRLLWERVEKLVPRPGSGSSSGSSNSGSQPGSHPGSQSGSGERFRVRCRGPCFSLSLLTVLGYDQYLGNPSQSCKTCGFYTASYHKTVFQYRLLRTLIVVKILNIKVIKLTFEAYTCLAL